jgi:hypothetical protein
MEYMETLNASLFDWWRSGRTLPEADDAKIPIHLWNRSFQRRRGTRHLLGCASLGSVGLGKSC